MVVFADDKPAATPSTSSADIDRLLSTAPTAIPRPIAFVQPQKDVNARPQHSTPLSAPGTPTITSIALPATQRSLSTPVTPSLPATPTAGKHGHANGIPTTLASPLAAASPKLTSALALTPAAKLTPSPKLAAASSSTVSSSAAVDDNTFHPALHQLFPLSQLPGLSKWPAGITGPGAGQTNQGNSCFLNATLQALAHTPMLVNYCLSRQHSQHCQIKHQKPLPPPPPPPAAPKAAFGFGMWRPSQPPFQSSLQHQQQQQPLPPFCLFCALEDNIIRSFKQSGAFPPSTIFNRLPTISRSLRRGRQEDAHEFLRLAFDMLQSNVLAVDLPSRPASTSCSSSSALAASKAPLPLPKGSSVPPALFATLTPAQLHRIKETSVLYQIFSGYYRSTLTCRSCHQPSHTFEPFLDLSLSIPTSSPTSTPHSSGFNRFPQFGFNRPYQPFHHSQPQSQPLPPLTLHQCLRAFTSEEQLDTDNMYKCTTCKKKTRAAKRLTIHTAPNVLVVHLKRFEHSGLGMGSGGGKIGRMVRFETVLDVSEYMSERGGGADGKVEYELYGVLVHAGSTLYSGHYYSFVKAADGRWYEMNDSSVQRRTVEEVLAQKAYILFYTKKVIDTGVKGATAAGGAAGEGKVGRQPEKEMEGKKEKVAAAPISVVSRAVKESSADDLIKAMMKGKVSDGLTIPHSNGNGSNGNGVKAADERKEQPSEKPMVEERKEAARQTVAEEEQKAAPAVLSSAKSAERAEESKEAAAEDGRDQHKEPREQIEEKRVGGNRISLARTTIHQTTVHISLLTPATATAASTSTNSTASPVSLHVRPPSSPLSPPAALSSPLSGSSSSKRKQLNGSSPQSAGWYPGMPSFRAGSQAKFTAFAAAMPNGGPTKKVKRETMGSGMGVGIRLVPYSSSSSSDDEEPQEERKASSNGVPRSGVEAEMENTAERKEVPILSTQQKEKAAASPLGPQSAAIPAPADEQKREPHHAENNDRKRRRLDVEATTTHSTATPSTSAIRFDPHAGRHTVHSHYGTDVGTWEDDEKGKVTEQERRERDEVLRRLERERRGRWQKDEYDVLYDEGKKRKVRGEKDEWRGVAAKEGENLLQREQERREGRGDGRDERYGHDNRRHSDSHSRHGSSDRQQSSHHRYRDDRDRSRNQHSDRDRRHSSSSSHSSRRDDRPSPHSHGSHRDNDRDRSRHSWSHRR